MTDWWSFGNDGAGKPATTQNVAAQVRAQNDLNMVNVNAGENSSGDNLVSALSEGELEKGELQRSAANICRYLIGTPAFFHMLGRESELDLDLKNACSEEELSLRNMEILNMTGEETQLDVSGICTEKGGTTAYNVTIQTRGIYSLSLVLRAVGGGELAQLPMSVYKDREVMKTLTLNGRQTEWMTEQVPLKLCLANQFCLRFFFAQSGIEIREAKLILEEDWEDRIKQYLISRGAADH